MLSLKFVSLRSDEQRDSQIQDKLHFQGCKLGDFGFQPVQEIIQNSKLGLKYNVLTFDRY